MDVFLAVAKRIFVVRVVPCVWGWPEAMDGEGCLIPFIELSVTDIFGAELTEPGKGEDIVLVWVRTVDVS